MDRGFTLCSPLCMVPPVALMRLAVVHGGVSFDAGEHYVKQSFRNRYHILTANGVTALTIPVMTTGGVHCPTHQIHIEHRKPWLREHLRSIEAAYGSSPYYIHYIDEVTALLSTQADTIGSFFSQTFVRWCSLLRAEPTFTVSEQYITAPVTTDLRPKIKHPQDFPEGSLTPAYTQVWCDRFAFQPHLSVIDLLFNEGPAAGSVLRA